MKRMLYLAIGLLAVAACTRQPVFPEEPETGKVFLTDVTLVAGIPETRTELGISPQLPLWSADDAIDVMRIGTPEYDENYSPIVHPFFSGLGSAANMASFHNGAGDAIEFGTYWAAYPRVDYDDIGNWKGVELTGYQDEEFYSYLEYTLPQEQYPTPTSFDKDADLLISKPFTIGAENYDATSQTATVSLEFTRMNAIVKVVLQDKTNDGQGGLLTGQTVKKVVLGYLDTELEGISYAPAATRVTMDDGDDGNTSLAGKIRVDLGEDGSFNCGFTPFQANGVAAIYTSETEYAIGQTGAATYLVVNPCVLKNGEDDLFGVSGLRVLVETEDMVIERYVNLPADGVALQPSRMTTLNIGLFDDGVKQTHIVGKGIGVVQFGEWNDDTEEYEILPVQSLSVDFGEDVEVMVKLYGIDPDLVDISDFEFGPQDSGVIGLAGDPNFYDGLVQGIRIYGIDLGEATFTVSLEIDGSVYSVSIPVTVTLGEHGRSLDGNYGEDNKPGGGINGGNTVIVGGEL